MPLTIAIDGPVGAGKSSLSDAAAKRLGVLHLDTGAMYRAVGLAALDAGIAPEDEDAVCALCEAGGAEIDVTYQDGAQRTFLNGVDVSSRIRTQKVGMAASSVSRYAKVRKMLVKRQQALAARQSILVDGRDICTVVLPDAKVKIFLTASAEVRAKRRMLELRAKGDQTPFEQILSEVNARDLQDTTRAVDPLQKAPDATVLDTSELDFDQSVDAIIHLVEARYGRQ